VENHRPESTDEQLEQHSLPGTNMAGKKAADDCESNDEQSSSPQDAEEKSRPGNSENDRVNPKP
jgi:hypothetical protein